MARARKPSLFARLFKLAFILVILLAVALGAAFAWLTHANLASLVLTQLQKHTGMIVQADTLSLKLFPTIQLDATNLVVPTLNNDGNTLFTTRHVALKAHWGSFPTIWQGIELQDLSLEDPSATLVVDADGHANYLPVAISETVAPTEAAAKKSNAPFALPVTQLGQVAISNLNLTYLNLAGKQAIKARNIALNVDARDLAHTAGQLTGSVNGQPVNGKLTVGANDLTNLPVDLTLAAANLQLAVMGAVTPAAHGNPLAFAGNVRAQSPNIQATAQALTGNAPAGTPASPLSLSGGVAYSGNQVALKNFAASLGTLLQAQGDVSASLAQPFAAAGTLSASGSNLRTLAALVPGLGATAQKLPAEPFKLQTTIDGQKTIHLKDTTFALGTLVTAKVEATLTPAIGSSVPDATGSLAIVAPNLKALGSAFGVQAALPTEQLVIATDLDAHKGTYTLSNLSAKIGSLLEAKGKFTAAPGTSKPYDGSLTITGPSTVALARGFGLGVSGVPATGFTITSDITSDGAAVSLPNLNLNLPALLAASGKIKLTPPTAGKPLDTTADLTFTKLNLDAFGFCNPPPAVSSAASSNVTAPPQPDGASKSPWSDSPLDTSALNKATFAINADIKGIACQRAPLTALTARLTNTPSALTITQLDATIGSGTLKTTASLAHSGTPELKLTLNGSKISVEELAPTLKQKGIVLPLDLTASLASHGNTSRLLASNLAGNLKAAATSGQLPYGSILGQAGNLAGGIKSFMKGATGTSTGGGKIDSLDARYAITNGQVATDACTISVDGGKTRLKGTGSINLPQWTIDYALTPTVGGPSSTLSIPILIKGTLSSPAIGPDPAAVQRVTGNLVTQGLKGLLGKDTSKGLGGALGSILGGKASTGGDTTGAAAPSQGDQLNSLVNGLFKKKKN